MAKGLRKKDREKEEMKTKIITFIMVVIATGIVAGTSIALVVNNPASAKTRVGVKYIAVSGSKFRPGISLYAPKKYHGKHIRKYSWARCSRIGKNCVRIGRASHRKYVITKRDIGHTLVVRMTVGNTIVQSTPTGVVGPALPVNTAIPTISDATSGSVQNVTVGDVLNGTLGSWTGAVDYSWAWQRCLSGTCTTISGATGGPTSNVATIPTYTIQSADQGDTLQLLVTAFNTPQ